MAMWSLLGSRPVDVFHWESFGKGWFDDAKNELKLKDLNGYSAEYGQLPDLSKADFTHDVVFAWNGTTSGVRVPNGDWIKDDREGLTLWYELFTRILDFFLVNLIFFLCFFHAVMPLPLYSQWNFLGLN